MVPAHLRQPLTDLLLSVADDKFLLGHRNADWTGLGPILEEDIAFSSIAQDEIAHADTLYQLIHRELGGAAPNHFAYGRKPHEYRCASLVERPDEFDWARAVVRQFLCDHLDVLRLQRLAHANWKPLADLAGRLLAEERVHVEHADAWIIRLGKGTPDSRAKSQAALDRLRPDLPGLFEPTPDLAALESAGLYPPLAGSLADVWYSAVKQVADEGGLTLGRAPAVTPAPGGRSGEHTPEFDALLAELCEVYRSEPNAQW